MNLRDLAVDQQVVRAAQHAAAAAELHDGPAETGDARASEWHQRQALIHAVLAVANAVQADRP